jgi:predicted Zn-dependent protease
MGQIHLAAGRLAPAEAALRRAVTMAPDSDTAHYVLARTLLRLGQADAARQHLDEFRRLQEKLLEQQRQKYERDLAGRSEALQQGRSER